MLYANMVSADKPCLAGNPLFAGQSCLAGCPVSADCNPQQEAAAPDAEESADACHDELLPRATTIMWLAACCACKCMLQDAVLIGMPYSALHDHMHLGCFMSSSSLSIPAHLQASMALPSSSLVSQTRPTTSSPQK